MRNIEATGNLFGETITIKQISKVKAKKLFADGEPVYLQSSNMSPFNMWQSILPITLDKDELKSSEDFYKICEENKWNLPVHPPTPAGQFNARINEYSTYNCDSERGKYITFYAKKP